MSSSAPQATLARPLKCEKISTAEKNRLQKLHLFEEAARLQGFSAIAGIDEAGRGPLAGPVVAAACIIPKGVLIAGVNDSKQLAPKKRLELFLKISTDQRIDYGVGIIPHTIIDEINIFQATIKAMLLAVENLSSRPDFLLVDGINLPHPSIPVKKIVRGDEQSHSIAAASILAKETRDRLMVEEHQKWPHYGFDKHKGYGTPEHLSALEKYGPCPIHRRSFAPVKKPENS